MYRNMQEIGILLLIQINSILLSLAMTVIIQQEDAGKF